MKRISIPIKALLAFTLLSSSLRAQEQSKEIQVRIEKAGNAEYKLAIDSTPVRYKKEYKMRVMVKRDKSGNGEEIMINDKPLGSLEDIQLDTIIQSFTVTGDNLKEVMGQHPDWEGMGFDAEFLQQFKNDNGKATAFLGVLSEKAAEGARVVEITKESAAAKAGLQKDDIITKVGEDKITDPANLAEVIASKKPKELVKLYYTRNEKESSVQVTLGERKNMQTKVFTFKGSPKIGKGFTIPDMLENLGEEMVIIENSEEDHQQMMPGMPPRFKPNNQFENSFPHQKKLGIKIQDLEEGEGVKVISIEKESAAEKAGLQKGDILVSIGGIKVDNTDEARQQLRPTPSKNSYIIKAKRGGKEMNFEVKYPKKINTIDL